VSSPGSSSFRHYVTAAKWESKFSPTANSVNKALAWLKKNKFNIQGVAKDRITISASGTASQVEKAFGTNLKYYKLDGQVLRMATSSLSVPASLTGVIIGAMGVNQELESPADVTSETASSSKPAQSSEFPPAPAAFRTAPPCGDYYGQKSISPSPAFGNGYPTTVPYEVCGYKPGQFRSAYGVSSATTGSGVTVAIVDAYGSATIASDSTKYFDQEDPTNPFSKANFTQDDATPFDNEAECAASSWLDEQAIDVQSVHSTAPDASILYVGAQDCLSTSLFNADQEVIDNNLASVVTNSWADTGGDLFDDLATKTAFDDVFMLADTSGITVQFSSGDDGDNYNEIGLSSANYPSESPYVTAVGGTSLLIGKSGQQVGDLGWATGRSFLCTANVVGGLPGCTSSKVGTWMATSLDGASGGFTSYNYTQPWYQASVVPSSLSLRNEDIDGPSAMRVIPDISLDADPGTGFLIGLHETFPNGTVKYATTRYGGTSLASPLLAGLIADVDSASIAAGGAAVGFLNPSLYHLNTESGAIQDIVSGGLQADYRVDHANTYVGGATGTIDSFREFVYDGPVTYCDETGNCETRTFTQTVTPGYDSLTGLGSIGPDFISDLTNL
jgi:subtilase family serine protease